MAKAKKIIIGALAAGIVAATTCIVASASTNAAVKSTYNEDAKAFFMWGPAYAELMNMSDYARLASASVYVYKNKTQEIVGKEIQTDTISRYGSVVAEVPGNYPVVSYYSECHGVLYASGSHYAPVEWSILREYPE